MNLRCGSYMIAVTPLHLEGAPTATFAVSKNSSVGSASIVRVSAVPGHSTYTEHLEMTWPSNSMILLRKTGPGYDGQYLVDMNLKFLSVPEALIPTDAASRAYVDHQIQTALQLEFDGVTVSLRDDALTPVAALRFGSYLVAVSSLVYGGPSATFAISKIANSSAPSIFRMTSCAGLDTGEQLEVVWPDNSKILLRKSGPSHDGDYLFDMNLKISQALPRP